MQIYSTLYHIEDKIAIKISLVTINLAYLSLDEISKFWYNDKNRNWKEMYLKNMDRLIAWVQEILGMDNAGGIIALSALVAWLLPKLVYFLAKFIFSTLLFLANVFGRDKIELWLKSKLNRFLANLVRGAKIDDIPRWLNKDQLALRELHWERAGLIIDVPSVIVTINLPTFGYNAVKLKLKYLFDKPAFNEKLRDLLHTSVREVRIQEPAISYSKRDMENFAIPGELRGSEPKEQTRENIFQVLEEAISYHFHILIEHGSLQLTLGEEHFVVQNLNFDLYNRAISMEKSESSYKLSLMLTGLYDGANVSFYNLPDSITEYVIVINKIVITSGMWRLLCCYCPSLQQIDVSQKETIGLLKDIRLEASLKDEVVINRLEGEYRIFKPRVKAWYNFESPASFEGSLGWDEQGLQLPDNFLVFKNGLRIRIPCEWQSGKLKMNFPTIEDLKQQYLGIAEQAKESVKHYKEKLLHKVKNIL